MTDQATQSECMAMGTVEAHEKLKPFAGTFIAEVRMWMGPGEPLVSTGVMTNTLDLGGRFLHQDYKGDQTEGPFPDFEGRGYWGFNTVTNKYEGFWIDSASTMMQTDVGDVDASGKIWNMQGQMPDPRSGQTMTKRSVITFEDRDHHTMAMFFKGPDGNECKAMEIAYTRKK